MLSLTHHVKKIAHLNVIELKGWFKNSQNWEGVVATIEALKNRKSSTKVVGTTCENFLINFPKKMQAIKVESISATEGASAHLLSVSRVELFLGVMYQYSGQVDKAKECYDAIQCYPLPKKEKLLADPDLFLHPYKTEQEHPGAAIAGRYFGYAIVGLLLAYVFVNYVDVTEPQGILFSMGLIVIFEKIRKEGIKNFGKITKIILDQHEALRQIELTRTLAAELCVSLNTQPEKPGALDNAGPVKKKKTTERQAKADAATSSTSADNQETKKPSVVGVRSMPGTAPTIYDFGKKHGRYQATLFCNGSGSSVDVAALATAQRQRDASPAIPEAKTAASGIQTSLHAPAEEASRSIDDPNLTRSVIPFKPEEMKTQIMTPSSPLEVKIPEIKIIVPMEAYKILRILVEWLNKRGEEGEKKTIVLVGGTIVKAVQEKKDTDILDLDCVTNETVENVSTYINLKFAHLRPVTYPSLGLCQISIPPYGKLDIKCDAKLDENYIHNARIRDLGHSALYFPFPEKVICEAKIQGTGMVAMTGSIVDPLNVGYESCKSKKLVLLGTDLSHHYEIDPKRVVRALRSIVIQGFTTTAEQALIIKKACINLRSFRMSSDPNNRSLYLHCMEKLFVNGFAVAVFNHLIVKDIYNELFDCKLTRREFLLAKAFFTLLDSNYHEGRRVSGKLKISKEDRDIIAQGGVPRLVAAAASSPPASSSSSPIFS